MPVLSLRIDIVEFGPATVDAFISAQNVMGRSRMDR
jgi:hypothetical protein